ncbi:uncharacterized protein LOC124452023 [Xenia sp. Carnegie-2017]|uniref:uncharacterized protein LOC124452023 n=1 Tax=Xenia sp. Carnegie-2017 TaxID=2897299 RepID=UPI001F04EFCD|nr:uncharacterized protein LOC124452023 [Xenia sp. Carnegie-2017]
MSISLNFPVTFCISYSRFYYTLGNIRRTRSHLNSIQLLGLVSSKHLKIYGVEPVLRAFLRDLQKLEQVGGYEFIINNQRRCFAGTIAFISGDNLGSQYLGGFKQGSQSYRKCRVCMGNATEITEMFHEDDFVLNSARLQ